MRVFWYLGIAIQVVGLVAFPVALFVGVYGDNLGAEWMIAAGAFVVFMIGTGIRRAASGE